MGLPLRIDSPQGFHTAVLSYAGEIRFGPVYCHLSIDGRFVDLAAASRRVFGNTSSWSLDDRFFAIQEWHSIEESAGPRTAVAIFDVVLGQDWRSDAIDGFLEPIQWNGDVLTYSHVVHKSDSTMTTDRTIDIARIGDWRTTA